MIDISQMLEALSDDQTTSTYVRYGYVISNIVGPVWIPSSAKTTTYTLPYEVDQVARCTMGVVRQIIDAPFPTEIIQAIGGLLTCSLHSAIFRYKETDSSLKTEDDKITLTVFELEDELYLHVATINNMTDLFKFAPNTLRIVH